MVSAVATAWSPGGAGSSSPRWSSPVNQTVKLQAGEKRSSSAVAYDDPPVSVKRRHRGKRHKSSTGPLPRPNVLPSPPMNRGGPPACPETHEPEGGYNSEDEYSHLGVNMSEEEWLEKDRRFERVVKKQGYIIKYMVEDGNCLFRSVADQVYGDQEMHACVRDHCMDYISQNADYYSQYMTEDIDSYVERKRYSEVHGNHLEIQALSEMYNRPIHIYCYSLEPINIFQNFQKSEKINVPIRLCYHRACHYNSLVDPHQASIGIGLGLPGFQPGLADRNLLGQACKASENDLVENTMLEDKLKATDWEATNEAIEEQVARESYLQWLRDNERRNGSKSASASATVTSGDLRTPKGMTSPKASCSKQMGSPKHHSSLLHAAVAGASANSPKAGCSTQCESPLPCTSSQSSQTAFGQCPGSTSNGSLNSSESSEEATSSAPSNVGRDYDGFQLFETASFLSGLPPNMFGLEDWAETDVLTQVLAASQQEYLDSLKQKQASVNDNGSETACSSSAPPSSSSSSSSSSASSSSKASTSAKPS
ncbi:OTU domain-containing protein 5-like [Tigriopus californicus]|nr:OTU domain-containing protein 5-like [Tigriopus californicus]